jgi:PAS domain S-box-containing protein
LESKREFEARTIAHNLATSQTQSLEKQLARSLSSGHALATVVKREFEARALAESIATSQAQILTPFLPSSVPADSAMDTSESHNSLSNFDELAGEMIEHYGGITNLQLAPNGIVQHIFPLEGHQKAIGLDLNQNLYAIAAIRSKKMTVEGPIQLVQGGVAILGRTPVFLSNPKSGNEEFWGFSTVLIELPQLFESVGIKKIISTNYLFEFARIDTFSGKRTVFFKSSDSILHDPVTVEIDIPNGQWLLSLVPKTGWHSLSYSLLEGLLVLIFSGLLSLLSYRHLLKRNELQAQKSEYEIIFNSAPAFIIYKDCLNHIMRVNKAAADSLNLTPDEIEGKHSKDVYPKQFENHFSDDLEVIKSGEPKLGIVESYQSESGDVKWVQTNKVPYRDNNGNVQGVLLFAIDITKQKEAETQALDYLEKLKKANKELEQFSAIASHDLQEPLRKIIVFGDRLGESINLKDSEGKEYLERMQKSATRMQLLIDDLLKFAQLKSQFAPFKPVNLNNIVHDVLLDLESRIQKSKGIVEVEELPTLDADPAQMHQLFLNLIGNALKFQRKGAVPKVIVRNSHEDNHHYIISVEDNGIGIDETFFGRIFRPFERLHGRSEYEGTGMGLSICDKIVTHHGGKITVTNNKEVGVTFTIILPEQQVSKET